MLGHESGNNDLHEDLWCGLPSWVGKEAFTGLEGYASVTTAQGGGESSNSYRKGERLLLE